MRVKLQLVLCSEDGREETVTDIVSLNKDSHRIEHLGLTLARQLANRPFRQGLSQQATRECLMNNFSPVFTPRRRRLTSGWA